MVTKLNNKSVYGFHVKIYQLTDDHLMLDPARFLKQLCSSGWIILYLKRNNVLRQAVSNELAFKRGLFHLPKEERGRKCVEKEYDIEKLNDSLVKTYERVLA